MAKFRYYITVVVNGEIVGTDDSGTAKNFALNEDCFVVDTETGTWLMSDNRVEPIQKFVEVPNPD